jgi:hypothetical protein
MFQKLRRFRNKIHSPKLPESLAHLNPSNSETGACVGRSLKFYNSITELKNRDALLLYTPKKKILAEALASIIIGLMDAYGGLIFTLIMMGVHLHCERRRSQR